MAGTQKWPPPNSYVAVGSARQEGLVAEAGEGGRSQNSGGLDWYLILRNLGFPLKVLGSQEGPFVREACSPATFTLLIPPSCPSHSDLVPLQSTGLMHALPLVF